MKVFHFSLRFYLAALLDLRLYRQWARENVTLARRERGRGETAHAKCLLEWAKKWRGLAVQRRAEAVEYASQYLFKEVKP